MKRVFLNVLAFVLANQIYAQSTDAGIFTGNNWAGNKFLGWNNTNGVNPLEIRTNSITRLQINGNTGLTAGFVGIGTNAPNSPMSIGGVQQLNAQGWNRGISLSNSSAILWENNGGNGYFMAHPSGTPNGNLFYLGLRKLSTNPAQEVITETVFLWSDNANAPDGPDKMVFRFSGFGGLDFTSSFQRKKAV